MEVLLTVIGMIGLEPTTSASQKRRSSQTELHPEIGTLGIEPRPTRYKQAALPLSYAP
jgi:hypothetical protein